MESHALSSVISYAICPAIHQFALTSVGSAFVADNPSFYILLFGFQPGLERHFRSIYLLKTEIWHISMPDVDGL